MSLVPRAHTGRVLACRAEITGGKAPRPNAAPGDVARPGPTDLSLGTAMDVGETSSGAGESAPSNLQLTGKGESTRGSERDCEGVSADNQPSSEPRSRLRRLLLLLLSPLTSTAHHPPLARQVWIRQPRLATRPIRSKPTRGKRRERTSRLGNPRHQLRPKAQRGLAP